jgi:class 3 adenylate cyclase/tetratricopeptide (TPR) repeat protein
MDGGVHAHLTGNVEAFFPHAYTRPVPLCPVCEQENPEVARFCLACGAALTAEPAREERKVVTVLFADLVGFTSRAEQLDPEDVRAVLGPYWERLRGELEKRGGTVEKFIGDAVMALFGAPVAHDDDPLRAVGAALAIRDWAREEADVQVRIAVNTGEALVLLGARPAEGEGMAAGDVVNTTARLQSAAPVNGVLVGETTYRATRDVIEYVEHEPVKAKGKADPIPVWEALQVRSRLGMDVERAMSPLVGRVRELGVIVDAFERAKSEGEPQLVTLVGVPGIGKSRLVGAFFSHLESQPDLVWWRQGRALPYGEGVSFWALSEMVKAHAGVDENDDAQTAAAKLRESVEAFVDPGERAWVFEHLLPLVGLEGSGSGESAPAWRHYIEALADARPLVMVFEDMHWADEGLLDFIDHLVDWATGVPLLVIATARPELLERRPAWGGGKLNVSTIALTPLSDDEAAEIIHGVLERAALPVETQQALVERAGGNPLYAEQFARLYMERGSADDLPLPETVQGLIAARLDGLGPNEKRLVQDASVFGKVFWAGALSGDDVDGALHSLERKGLVRRERRSAVAGETQYAFRHVLVRDVAYGQLPRAGRAEKHVAAADWIERLGRIEDSAELVAHHLGSALEVGLDVADRARHAFRRAGDRAQALGANDVAERHYARALELWPEPDDPDRARLVAAHARAAFAVTANMEAVVDALDALERVGLVEDAASFAAFAAQAAWLSGRRDTRELLARGTRLLDGRPPSPAHAALLAEEARVGWFAGDYENARAALTKGIELSTLLALDELRADLLVTTGVVALTEGDLDESRRVFAEAVAAAPPGSPARQRALVNASVVEATEGDLDAYRLRHEEAVAEAARVGDVPRLRFLAVADAIRAMDEGEWDEVLRAAESDLLAGEHYQARGVQMRKALVLAARGALDEACAIRDAVLAATRDGDDLQSAIPTYLDAAWLSYVAGEPDRARGLVETAWPIVRDSPYRAPGAGASTTTVVVAVGYAEQWLEHFERATNTRRVVAATLQLQGRTVEAADAWARVSPYDEAVARIEAARKLVGEGRRAEGDVQLQRGLAFFRAVGARRIIEQAEALLAAAS